jgi:hypothetical protein
VPSTKVRLAEQAIEAKVIIQIKQTKSAVLKNKKAKLKKNECNNLKIYKNK